MRRTQSTTSRIFGHTDRSSEDGNTSGGSQSTSSQQFLNDTTFTQQPKKKRMSPVKVSQAIQQKQSQLDQATAAVNATLSHIQQDVAEEATDRRSCFQNFLGIKFQDIPDNLWDDFEFNCLTLIRKYRDMGRQQQQPAQQQPPQWRQIGLLTDGPPDGHLFKFSLQAAST